jgi:two-component system, sensor histidine kinase and response regulator
MLTSGSSPGDIARCKALGGSAHLMKPVKQSDLFDAIVSVAGTAHPVEQTAETKVEIQKEMRPLRILLAEDSYANQRLAVGLLSKWGHQVTVANNGLEAVVKLQQENFDFVLMDVQMPEMDGYQATAVIRERESRTGKHTPIIAMTAHAMKGDREECLAAGMDDYLSKPIRQVELRRIIAEISSFEAINTQSSPMDDSLAQGSDSPLDWEVAVEAAGGDRELLREVLASVIEECPRCLDQANQAIRESDAKSLRLAAHTIKGHLRLFGSTRAGDLAERLENDGCEGANELLMKLRRETEAVLREIQSHAFAEESGK